jgi:hypothetical protein
MWNGIIFLLLIEKLSDFSLHLFSWILVGLLLFGDDVLEIDLWWHNVSCGNQVIIVHWFNESLNLWSSLDFLLTHSSCDLQSILFNTGYQCVSKLLVLKWIDKLRVRTYFHSFIVLSNNYGFFSSMSTCEQNYNSTWFHTNKKGLVNNLI